MRVVIKVGTSSLVNGSRGTLALSTLAALVEAVAALREADHQVVVVSSGAVGCGCIRLGLRERPDSLPKKQALAAIGQTRLMRQYEDMFGALGLLCAQVLLTYENLNDRSQFVNARNTFDELLRYGVIPVVNENDTVAVEELRFGDNDTLSAKVASLLDADWLFLLTDIDAVYTANPRKDPSAQRIARVPRLAAASLAISTQASDGVQWGTGGMGAKVRAATLAAAAGIRAVIASAADPGVVVRVFNGADEGTVFEPALRRLRGRKKWVIGLPPRGRLVVDAGAERALLRKKSLFAAGVVRVEGDFEAQDAVSLVGASGGEVARGLANYSSGEVRKLLGAHSADVAARLGWQGAQEIVHRASIALVHAGVDSDATSGGEEPAGEERATAAARAPAAVPTPADLSASPEDSADDEGDGAAGRGSAEDAGAGAEAAAH